MKRLIPAIALLLVIAFLVVYSRIAVRDIADDLIGVLNIAVQYNEQGDYEKAQAKVEEFHKKMDTNAFVLNTFVDRNKIYVIENATAPLLSFANEDMWHDFSAEANKAIACVEEIKFTNI